MPIEIIKEECKKKHRIVKGGDYNKSKMYLIRKDIFINYRIA